MSPILGQVEAALTGDPGNEELLALKKDLDEIISITSELVEETNNKVSDYELLSRKLLYLTTLMLFIS